MAAAKATDKSCISHVEDIEEGQMGDKPDVVTGTVKLTEGSIVYIPTPTADPQGSHPYCHHASMCES